MYQFEVAHADLDVLLARWRHDHGDGCLEDAVRDLELWPRPHDRDVQWLIWQGLRRLGDPAALQGFHEMRAAADQRESDLAKLTGEWGDAHRDGSAQDAVRELMPWRDPADSDAWRYVRRHLPVGHRAMNPGAVRENAT
jgi:hypothetical protein